MILSWTSFYDLFFGSESNNQLSMLFPSLDYWNARQPTFQDQSNLELQKLTSIIYTISIVSIFIFIYIYIVIFSISFLKFLDTNYSIYDDESEYSDLCRYLNSDTESITLSKSDITDKESDNESDISTLCEYDQAINEIDSTIENNNNFDNLERIKNELDYLNNQLQKIQESLKKKTESDNFGLLPNFGEYQTR